MFLYNSFVHSILSVSYVFYPQEYFAAGESESIFNAQMYK